MRYAEKRANLWYAVLTVPRDVRHAIGRDRYVQSTQTADKQEAAIRVALLVAGWKAEINKARGVLADPKADFWAALRRDFLNARSAGDEATELAVRDIAETAALKMADRAEGSLAYRIATGQAPELVQLAPLVTEWRDSLKKTHAQKTIDQQHRDVSRMADHFKHLAALVPQRVKAWTDKLMGEGATASSLDRIGKGCRSFWLYLQQAGTVDMLDPDPFVGAFQLARRNATRNTTDRSGSSYTPKQLAALYAAALDKKDQPLADLIALGAYTGARIEELCTLTKETVRDGVFHIGGTKTKAARRDCPIHPAVAPLVTRLLAASRDGFLVPSTADNQYANRSGPLSQRFGHLKRAAGFGPGHVFHSTRNTLATMLEQSGAPEGIAADILGHEKKTLSYGLYSSGSSMAQKVEAISKVAYPAPLNCP